MQFTHRWAEKEKQNQLALLFFLLLPIRVRNEELSRFVLNVFVKVSVQTNQVISLSEQK